MTDQQEIISKIKDKQAAKKNVILTGNARCDSPGSSAKYCAYTLMNHTNNEIVHFEIIDKREVALKSPNI